MSPRLHARLARPRTRDESGAVAIVVAFLSVVMFGFAAIVVDLGQARTTRVQLQTAADAAALAATNTLYAAGTPVPDVVGAVLAATRYADRNAGVTAIEWAACTDPSRPAEYVVPAGVSPCISFFPNLTRPGRVRVALPTRSTTSYFSGALGLRTPSVSAAAEADVRVDGRSPCALCVLGTGTHAISQGNVVIKGGDIHFNGNVSLGSNGITSADGAIVIQGTFSGGSYSPTPKAGPLMTDPLASYPLPQPPTYGGLPTTPKSDPCTQGPGVYGAWSIQGSATCTLSPGLYVVAGGSSTSWKLAGSGTLRGTGVTLLFTCGTSAAPRNCNVGETGASLDGTGESTVTMSAPTAGVLQGYTVVYDRNSIASYRMAGNAVSTIRGSVYMRKGTTVMTGNGCLATYSVLIIVGDLAASGDSSCLNATYDPTTAAQAPADNLRLTK